MLRCQQNFGQRCGEGQGSKPDTRGEINEANATVKPTLCLVGARASSQMRLPSGSKSSCLPAQTDSREMQRGKVGQH